MRLLIIEDEARLRSLLEKGLKEAGFAVDSATDGVEGLRMALIYPYDVIVLDLRLPKKDGLAVLQELRGAGRKTPVLILTVQASVNDRVRGLDAGADDYLAKPFAFAELLARIRALLRHGAATPSVINVDDLRIDLLARRVERAGERVELTAKEFTLLEYFARHVGEIVTRTMILEHVWDMNFDSASNVVDVYMGYLRRKIDDPFDRKLLHTRRGMGYVLCATP